MRFPGTVHSISKMKMFDNTFPITDTHFLQFQLFPTAISADHSHPVGLYHDVELASSTILPFSVHAGLYVKPFGSNHSTPKIESDCVASLGRQRQMAHLKFYIEVIVWSNLLEGNLKSFKIVHY